jgi:hypothetical protein
MTERTTRHSFIVRVYRIDTKDSRKLTGLVEAMDGSGERAPFIDIDELAERLSRGAGKRTGRRKKTESPAKRKAL